MGMDPLVWAAIINAGAGLASGGQKAPTEFEYWMTGPEGTKLKDAVYNALKLGQVTPGEETLRQSYTGTLQKLLDQQGGYSTEEQQQAYNEAAAPIQGEYNRARTDLDTSLAGQGPNAATSGYATQARAQLGAHELGDLSETSRRLALENASRRNDYKLNAAGLVGTGIANRSAERFGAVNTGGGFLQTSKIDTGPGGWAGLRESGWDWKPPDQAPATTRNAAVANAPSTYRSALERANNGRNRSRWGSRGMTGIGVFGQ